MFLDLCTSNDRFWSFHLQAKKIRKTLVIIVLWLLYDFLYLTNDVNVEYLQKVISIKNIFCWHLEGHCLKKQDPDPLVSGTDPRFRIRTKSHGFTTLVKWFFMSGIELISIISNCIAPVVCSFLSTTAQLYATHRKGGDRRKRHSSSTREWDHSCMAWGYCVPQAAQAEWCLSGHAPPLILHSHRQKSVIFRKNG